MNKTNDEIIGYAIKIRIDAVKKTYTQKIAYLKAHNRFFRNIKDAEESRDLARKVIGGKRIIMIQSPEELRSLVEFCDSLTEYAGENMLTKQEYYIKCFNEYE